MRILFDTNVLFAALTTRGFCEEVVEETIDLCTIVWATALRTELISALRRKRLVTPTVLQAIASFGDLCQMDDPIKLPKRVCRDPDDDIVLGSALAGRADLIITGDEDLLVLKKFQGIRILSPRQLLEILHAK